MSFSIQNDGLLGLSFVMAPWTRSPAAVGLAGELHELGRLVRAARVLVVAASRAGVGFGSRTEAADRFHDFLREAARRAGALRAAVELLSAREDRA
jgi:hypothetical protein